jgi:hypothetical protein
MIALPDRRGPRPRTTDGIPHQQQDQQPTNPALLDSIASRVLAWPHISEAPSLISLEGARAFVMDAPLSGVGREAFIIANEFAHIHAAPDSSLHAALPVEVAEEAIERGWCERHPLAGRDGFSSGLVMIYAPRDEQEADVVTNLLDLARQAARLSCSLRPLR